MKRFVRVSLLACLLCAFTVNVSSQLSISYYSFMSKIGVGYNFNERIWTELRLFGNTEAIDLTPELVVCYNVIQKEQHNFYVGLGGVVNIFNGIVVPVGLQFSPFEKLDRFSLHIEVEPTIDFDGDVIIQSAWGLRYKFIKKAE